jgi:hypothetical protein
MNEPNKLVSQYTWLESLARGKHSSLLGPFVKLQRKLNITLITFVLVSHKITKILKIILKQFQNILPISKINVAHTYSQNFGQILVNSKK